MLLAIFAFCVAVAAALAGQWYWDRARSRRDRHLLRQYRRENRRVETKPETNGDAEP